MDQITDAGKQRIAELVAEGAPPWKMHQEIIRSRFVVRRVVVALRRPAGRWRQRSLLRLSLAGREEISRGLAAGRPVRAIAGGLDRALPAVCREIAANGGPQAVPGVRCGSAMRSAGCAGRSRPDWLSARGCARCQRTPVTGTPAGSIVCVVRAREVAAGLIEAGWVSRLPAMASCPVAAGPAAACNWPGSGRPARWCLPGLLSLSLRPAAAGGDARDLAAQPQRAGSSARGLLFPARPR